MNKTIVLIAFIFLAFTCAFSQVPMPKAPMPNAPMPKKEAAAKPAAAETRLPSQAEIEAALQRTLGYDPSLSWQIVDIRPSVFPGVAEALVSLNKQQAVHIYLAPDSQNAIIGNLIPFGPNPFASTRSKLQAADGPARGAPAPSIVLVEFSDLQCPHCKAAQPVMEKLAADFLQVRYIFQQFPLPATLHPWAMKGAEYTDCAAQSGNQDAFWKYLESVFENQGSIALATAEDKLKELATTAGLDAAKISACAASPAAEARVKKSLDLGQSVDVQSTPTVFINGRKVEGIASIPYEQLKIMVQFEIDHAGK